LVTWYGFSSLGSLGNEETGARAALPIWVSIMRTALRDQPVEEFPAVPAATTDVEAARP
jgi:penicillin-binding protein 1A